MRFPHNLSRYGIIMPNADKDVAINFLTYLPIPMSPGHDLIRFKKWTIWAQG